MRVLAIDPGYDRLGVAVIEKINNQEVLIYSGCLETDKKSDLPDRILSLGTGITKLLETYQPTAVAIETIFFNKNQKTAVSVAQARGMIVYLAKLHHCTVYEYGPQQIKVAVTGYGNSDKTAVLQMVKRLVKNAPEKALDDEYDAIAVGITCIAHLK